jgi:hypothetical protein
VGFKTLLSFLAAPGGDSTDDGNASTVADTTWEALIATPNYPDYTSGANNLSGSATKMLQLFFGRDDVTFSIMSVVTNTTRTYTRFSDAAADVVEARILEGIHFRFADIGGRDQGRAVANWAFTR